MFKVLIINTLFSLSKKYIILSKIYSHVQILGLILIYLFLLSISEFVIQKKERFDEENFDRPLN